MYDDLEQLLAWELNCKRSEVWLHEIPDEVFRSAMDRIAFSDALQETGTPIEQAECLLSSWSVKHADWAPDTYHWQDALQRLQAERSEEYQ